ncbi:integumentary mucin C.1-like isoform X3 [Haliotis rufescens]|uniref:integumentary mucin C.1-like isoform X3 n=1 Tax=Haliotis rufescens TaxID=6454 RepID=UPI00201EB7C9|nr:integumentary mucin C.1-like isoform X3 [Haliotis rufescens]
MGARWPYVFLVVHFTSLLLMSKGQTCFFTEIAGQKGSEMLHSDSENTTDMSACKTLCNTTELCIAGEFLSTTNTCHIYLVETTLTGETESVFFQWNCTYETATTATTTASTTTMQTTTTTTQPTTTTPTTTMQPTTTTTATTTMQPTSTTTSTTTMQPTTTTPTTTTTTLRTTPTATTTTTTTPASMTTITRTPDSKRPILSYSGPSSGRQYDTEGAIAAALAGFAVLMCIPCLMCIILCRKNDEEDGRWVIYKGPGLRESLKKEIFIKRLSIQTMSTEIRG